jgi:hypothetical protein
MSQQTQPSDINFLNRHRFRVILKRTPNLVYFAQEANLPGISMSSATQPTPFVDLPIPGDKIIFEEFVMTFPVDEQMANYKEIAAWMIGLGFPKQFGQYKDLYDTADGIRSDIALMILDSQHQPIHTVFYRDAFPVSLSQLQFDVKDEDVVVLTATATFKYSYWELDEVNDWTPTITQADL